MVKEKGGVFFVLSIKLLWMKVLIAVMEYVTLDGRYDMANTYHFFLSTI